MSGRVCMHRAAPGRLRAPLGAPPTARCGTASAYPLSKPGNRLRDAQPSSCPPWSRAMKPFRKILVPVDFSAHSARAVQVAAELARRFDGTLDLVHVFDLVAYPLPDGYVMFTR